MDPTQLLDTQILIPVAIGFVIVLGIGIGIARMLMSRGKNAGIDRWANAAYSIWTGGEDCATWAPQRAQQALKN
jgi:hypothetical protein